MADVTVNILNGNESMNEGGKDVKLFRSFYNVFQCSSLHWSEEDVRKALLEES